MKHALEIGLIIAAAGQFCVAALNLSLVRIMGWKEDVTRMPLLIREVFHVHAWFISLTLAIFATITIRFAAQMADGSEPIYRWVACLIGVFWAVRAVIQVTYYSSSHWRGIVPRTIMHVILLAAYSGLTAVYLTAAL